MWNAFEGLGQPLAGEMQSAALFLPFVLLQLLPNGIFVMHLALELVAGFSTLLFLRELRLSWTASTAAGCLFALNGAFAFMTNAPFNPICFLPSVLWGVELVARGVREHRRPRAGIWVIGFSLAFMLFAGFPETAYLECIFVVVWCVIRFVDLPGVRRRFVLWLASGAVLGLVLALPILVAFKGFMGFGYAAYHSGESGPIRYLPYKFSALGLPYLTGPFSDNPISGGVAGFVTMPTIMLAVVGLLGRRTRATRILISLTLAVLLLNMFGVGVVHHGLNLLPGMSSILVYKYSLAIVEFILIMLAAFGIDDICGRRARPALIVGAAILSLGYLGASLWSAHTRHAFPFHRWTATMVGWTVLTICAIAGAALLARSSPARRSATAVAVAALIVIGDGIGMYAVPQLGASPRKPVDLAPVVFLQKHLGAARFYTLGPIQPNYGSYFGIAQLNVNDLPVPQKLADFVTEQLRPAPRTPGSKGTARAYMPYELTPLNFTPYQQSILLQGYQQKQSLFREAAVKYLVTAPGVVTPAAAAKSDLVRVFGDYKAEIWQDTGAAPYWRTLKGGPCTVSAASLTAATVDCTTSATLQRASLSTPDWTVRIGDATTAVTDRPGQLYQSVAVPAGRSRVEFDYRPKYFALATFLSLAAVAAALLDGALFLRRRRERTPRTSRRDDALVA